MRSHGELTCLVPLKGGRTSHSTVRAGEGARTVIAKHGSPKEIGESIDVSHVSFLSLALRLLEALVFQGRRRLRY